VNSGTHGSEGQDVAVTRTEASTISEGRRECEEPQVDKVFPILLLGGPSRSHV
jgi:hypothetical protein